MNNLLNIRVGRRASKFLEVVNEYAAQYCWYSNTHLLSHINLYYYFICTVRGNSIYFINSIIHNTYLMFLIVYLMHQCMKVRIVYIYLYWIWHMHKRFVCGTVCFGRKARWIYVFIITVYSLFPLINCYSTHEQLRPSRAYDLQ